MILDLFCEAACGPMKKHTDHDGSMERPGIFTDPWMVDFSMGNVGRYTVTWILWDIIYQYEIMVVIIITLIIIMS